MLYHLFGHPMSPIFGWILTINYNPHHCCARSIYVWCIPKYPRALNTVKGYHSLDLKYVYIVVYLCKNHVHIYIYIWYKHILYMQSEYTHYLSWTENSPSVHESSWWSLLSTWKKKLFVIRVYQSWIIYNHVSSTQPWNIQLLNPTDDQLSNCIDSPTVDKHDDHNCLNTPQL